MQTLGSRPENELTPRVVPYIFNSEGHIFEPIGDNIQEAVNDLPALGGKIWLPSDTLTVDTQIDINRRVHFTGVGPSMHNELGGTQIRTTAGLAGANLFSFSGAGLIHFSSLRNMTIYNEHANNAVYIDNLSDFLMWNVYINHSVQNCVYVEANAMDLWHLIFEQCWLENATLGGIRMDCADHDITKVHILNNRFYANDLGVIFQRAVDTGGQVRNALISKNIFLEMGKTSTQLWKVCNHISIVDNLYRESGTDAANTYDAIRVGDGNVPADLCQWIKIQNNIIDGQATSRYGISLEDSTDEVLVTGNMTHGCGTAAYNAEVLVTNVEKAHNIEV